MSPLMFFPADGLSESQETDCHQDGESLILPLGNNSMHLMPKQALLHRSPTQGTETGFAAIHLWSATELLWDSRTVLSASHGPYISTLSFYRCVKSIQKYYPTNPLPDILCPFQEQADILHFPKHTIFFKVQLSSHPPCSSTLCL